MKITEAESYLFSLGNEVAAMKLGLDSIRSLLAALDDPQKSYLKVQVAGTNGKGSVCAFLDSICREARIKTGVFTSPHLISVTERVRINGENISETDFARFATRVRGTAEALVARGVLETIPTYFEQVTAIALVAFADAGVELAILETGLGGRYDATTAADAEIAAITRIDLDHQQYLGETIEEIAAEKAAIIRSGSRVVVGDQDERALRAITESASAVSVDIGDKAFTLPGPFPRLGLAGEHQVENAKIAVGVSGLLRKHFSITDANVIEGLATARHAGRLESDGRYIFDGAHNPAAARALAKYLGEQRRPHFTMIFGAMSDKNVGEILAFLAPLAERVVLTEPSNSRSSTYGELLAAIPADLSKEKVFASDCVQNAIEIAEAVTPDDSIILVTGSLYLVGEVKKLLKENLISAI